MKSISSGLATRIFGNCFPSIQRCCAAIALVMWVSTSHVAAQSAASKEKTMSKNVSVVISTSMGDIEVELDGEKAPISSENFLSYVDEKFYDGTIFHRVIPNFMIQGGGMTPDMNQKPNKAPIKNEASNGLKNARGTLAMARTSIPDSATSQFFINHADNTFLDFKDPSPQGIGYAVFGKVTAGMDVVDKIAAVKTTRSGHHADVPESAVLINSIRRK